ncbi:MAG: GNAT family N-acetyltransferase [Gaiellaceae bacterium]
MLDHDRGHAAKIGVAVVDHIRDFRRDLQRAAADHVFSTPNGTAIVTDSTPDVYDSNYLSVEAPAVGAGQLAAEADVALEASHHRRVVVEDGAPGLADDFTALGFDRVGHLVLAHTAAPDRIVETAAIREVALEDILPPRTEATMQEPWGDAEIAAQLNESKRQVARAVPTRFFGAFAGDTIAGWCELRTRGGVAQIEDVEVLSQFRGRGLGRALVQHALDEGKRAAEVVFLEALADDWPRELYGKLGFTVVDRRDFYTRLPQPLTRLRLRTPRLELRLPTVAELRALYRVAEAGIHDPAVMPFEVPWTDSLNEGDFLAYHLARDARRLELVAFLERSPVGVQGLTLRLPEVSTGSWLGRAYQGRGLGTEMRAAVLTLAFDRLGAQLARSGAFAGNPQSLGVSRKLGYEATGSRMFAPRGEPVEHTDLELQKKRFSSPVPVAITGLEQSLPVLLA